MKVELIQTDQMTTCVGIRAVSLMSELGDQVSSAFAQLAARKHEIQTIKNPETTYGITPPNYKGNDGPLDFYCCYEVDPLISLPQGMTLLHIPPRAYAATTYQGPASQTYTAYDFTTNWLRENGYAYDDVSYYYEKYDAKTIRANDDARNEMTIYCPVKKQDA